MRAPFADLRLLLLQASAAGGRPAGGLASGGGAPWLPASAALSTSLKF